MKINEIQKTLEEMAGTVDLLPEVQIAFAENETADALCLIEARLRVTRAFLEVMETKCYEGRRLLREAAPAVKP